MAAQKLDQADATGVWAVSTETATYLVDLDGRTLQRTPAQEAPEGTSVSTLRRDTEVLPLLELGRCAVGWPMTLIVDVRGDGVATLRRTTIVREITELTV